MPRRAILATLLSASLLLAAAAPVLASHVHVRVLGNGQCVVIAEKGGEKWVQLPGAVIDRNPNVVPGAYPSDRTHPLHVLVHIGGAGNGLVFVYGSADDLANCADYVNG